ncbi:hypothetical protein LN650_32005 [Klebsiella pneumoniae subsp. pneumoniae]|nr:hypothetical protein [Klebsiella pneumoniae subsp. pneumoniae]
MSYADNRPIQSTEYRSSGVILDVKPQIRTDSIDLVIKQQLSSFAKTDILVVLQAKKSGAPAAAHAPSFHEARAVMVATGVQGGDVMVYPVLMSSGM